MSVFSSRAIVISSLKYGDSSLITKLYTEEKGLQSYLIRGVFTAKKGKFKSAYFQPLSQLTVVASYLPNKNLQSLREVRVDKNYVSITTNVVKQSLVLFISEVLSAVIKEEEANEKLYEYLETLLNWLEHHEKVGNFHLFFLLKLTQYLGFYPDNSNTEAKGFNLLEGSFTDVISSNHVLQGSKLNLFKKLLSVTFSDLEISVFSKTQKQELLESLIQYYELHIEGFKTPRSIKVLESIFR